jgi:hypothetical protein
MSYHGFGQNMLTSGAQISTADDSVAQPSGDVPQMATITVNPMGPTIDPSGYEIGDQAMMLEMQSRAGTISPVTDPAAFQQSAVDPGLMKSVAPTAQPTSPTVGTKPTSPTVGTTAMQSSGTWIPPTDEQLLAKMVLFWRAMMAGQQPSADLQQVMTYCEQQGKHEVIVKAEQIAMSQQSVPSGVAQTSQPSGTVTTQGAPVMAPMATHPVIGMSAPTGQITQYVPETGLNPAQPGVPVASQPSSSPTTYAGNVGQIATGNPSVASIPTGQSSVAQIATGDGSTAPITTSVESSIPGSNYVAKTTPVSQPKTEEKKSSVVPLIAAAGAALLLSRLL